jgi:hypothetical protein
MVFSNTQVKGGNKNEQFRSYEDQYVPPAGIT